MPRVRNRSEICPYFWCKNYREILLNLETGQPIKVVLPEGCTNKRACMEEMRDKARLAPFEDGKTRMR